MEHLIISILPLLKTKVEQLLAYTTCYICMFCKQIHIFVILAGQMGLQQLACTSLNDDLSYSPRRVQ